MACQASARVARGWIYSSGRLHGGRALVRDGRGKLLSFWECLCFIFSTIPADSCMVACTDPVATDTIPSAPRRERGAKRFLMRGLLVGGPAVAGLDPLLFLSCRSGVRRGHRVQHYLGSGPWRFGGGWRLAERERPRGCWVGAVLGRLWAAAGLERLGRKCRIACDPFCASVKRSADPSTAGPKRPLGEIGASRKETLSASLISVSVSHRWRSSTTRLAIDLPMAWAVVLVARKARSVALLSSLKVAGSGSDSSTAERSLAW